MRPHESQFRSCAQLTMEGKSLKGLMSLEKGATHSSAFRLRQKWSLHEAIESGEKFGRAAQVLHQERSALSISLQSSHSKPCVHSEVCTGGSCRMQQRIKQSRSHCKKTHHMLSLRCDDAGWSLNHFFHVDRKYGMNMQRKDAIAD